MIFQLLSFRGKPALATERPDIYMFIGDLVVKFQIELISKMGSCSETKLHPVVYDVIKPGRSPRNRESIQRGLQIKWVIWYAPADSL